MCTWLENFVAFIPSFIYPKTKGFAWVLTIIAWKSKTWTSH